MKLDIYNQKGEKVGDVNLSTELFDLEINESLVHQAMVTQMANERQVIAHTKDRSEVQGGGKKPWKQKGTGRARAGSNRSPIWIGGGVTFGPRKTRNFTKKINKKMKQKAMLMVISDKIKNNNLAILDKFEINEYKTKVFNEIIQNIQTKVLKDKNIEKEKKAEDKKKIKTKKAKLSILLVNEAKDKKTKFSGRNLAGIEIINSENINIVDLLKYKNLIITKDIIKEIENQYKK